MHTRTTIRPANKFKSRQTTIRLLAESSRQRLATLGYLQPDKHMQVDEQLIDLCWFIVAGLLAVRLLAFFILKV
jgi:DNA-binding TFAR19-related protein (PDSD5 family)